MLAFLLFPAAIFGAIGLAYAIPYPWARGYWYFSITCFVTGVLVALLRVSLVAVTYWHAIDHGTFRIPDAPTPLLLWLLDHIPRGMDLYLSPLAGILLIGLGMCSYLGFWFRED